VSLSLQMEEIENDRMERILTRLWGHKLAFVKMKKEKKLQIGSAWSIKFQHQLQLWRRSLLICHT